MMPIKKLTSSSAGHCLSADMAVCRMVPEVAKQFFPQMAVGFDDPRVQVHITDGIKYVQEAAENSFDVIIVDSSDPVGPAEVLFQKVALLLTVNPPHVSPDTIFARRSQDVANTLPEKQSATCVASRHCQYVVDGCM